MNMLSEMLSRWPRKRSQGPAGEMWSVVHLPLRLEQQRQLARSPCRPRPRRARAAAGARSRRRTLTVDARSVGRRRDVAARPRDEAAARAARAPAAAASSLNSSPSPRRSSSVSGLNAERAGERVGGDDLRAADEGQRLRVAVVAPGEVAVERGDDRVAARPSACRRASTGRCTGRRRWPAPCAPTRSSVASWPSRSMVAWTCSEPGRDQEAATWPSRRGPAAWSATSAARAMSS